MKKSKEIDLLPDQSLGEKLIKKGFWLYFFSYLIAPTGYIIKVLVSNTMSVSEVWLLYSILSFMILLSTYNGLWLTESIKYFLPKYIIDKDKNSIKSSIVYSLIVQLFTSIVVIVILVFGADWLAINYFHEVNAASTIKILWLYFLWMNLFQMLSNIFISIQDTFNTKIIEFIKMWATVIFVVLFFLFWESNIWTYSLSWILWLFISVGAGLIIFNWKYKSLILKWKLIFTKDKKKQYIKYSLWTFWAMNAAILLTQIDQQMAVVMLWSEAAGYLTNYLSSLRIYNLIVAPIMLIILPLISQLTTNQDIKKMGSMQWFFYTYLSIFALTLSWLFFVLWPEINIVLFGAKFLFSGKLLSLWWLFILFPVLWLYNYHVLGWLGLVKKRTYIIVKAAIINLILNYVGARYFGLYGIVVWTILINIFIFISFDKFIRNKISFWLDYKHILLNFFSIVILCSIIYWIKTKLFILDDIYRWENLLYLVVIWFVYYFLICFINYRKVLILKKEFKKIKA